MDKTFFVSQMLHRLLQIFHHPFAYHVRGNATQTMPVTTETWLVAEHRTRAARHRHLHGILLFLTPAFETAIRMRRTPHTDHRLAYQ